MPEFDGIVDYKHIHMKRNFPIWQITFPLCLVVIFGLGVVTTVYMVSGRYLFDLEVTPKRIRMQTDVDKRDSQPMKDTPEQDAGGEFDQLKSEF
jgi:hypothetical protein